MTSTWQTCAFSLPWPAVVILTVCSGTSIQMQSRACSRKRSNSKESQLRWGRQSKMHIWICVPYFHHPYLVKVKQWSWIQFTAHTSILQKCSQKFHLSRFEPTTSILLGLLFSLLLLLLLLLLLVVVSLANHNCTFNLVEQSEGPPLDVSRSWHMVLEKYYRWILRKHNDFEKVEYVYTYHI